MTDRTPIPVGGVARCSNRVMNLSHLLRQAAYRHGSHVGLVHGRNELTWRDVDQRVDAACVALTRLGVCKGDRVLVQSKNCTQLFESMFACFRAGAVWVPTNFRQSPEEVAYLAAASGAKLMICQSDFSDHAAAFVATAPEGRPVVSIGAAAFSQLEYDAMVAAVRGEAFPEAAVEHDDPCWFFFTSGTTGRPKAAVLTHGQMGFVVNNHLADLMPGTTEGDASLVVAPLSHGAGIHQLVNTARGAVTIIPESERLDLLEVWSLVERWRVTNIFTVPTILKLMVESPAVDQFDHSSLRYVIYAGAPMYREDQKHALKKLGCVLVQYYGLGEVTGNITALPPHLHSTEDGPESLVGSCGYVRTGMQVQVQDEHGNELPTGVDGEICVIGPAVFAGYYNNPEANEKAFRNGWFRTGDLGHFDSRGFLYITGRASDMYISGGSNIYPREIEEKILAHPAVREVAVVGVPDPLWGEVGVAVCVAHAGADLTEDDLLTWVAPKLARYKLPKRVFVLEELPRSGYGKITKALVRDELHSRGLLPLASQPGGTP